MTMTSTANGPVYRVGTSDAEIEATAALAKEKYRRKVLLLQLAVLVFLLGGWETFSRTGDFFDTWFGSSADGPRKSWIDPFSFSRPSQVVERLYEWMTEGTQLGSLWYQIWITMEEAVLGFLAGAIAGVLAGIALGRNKLAADVFSVYIKIFNAIPRIVLAPIFIIAFGFGIESKIAVSFVLVFFVVFANAFQGTREADRNMIANARILGASSSQVTRAVVVPSAMSWIFASLHVSFGFAITGAVVGELLGARYGIGQLIALAKGTFDAAGVFAGVVVLLVVAMVADFIMTFIENILVKWRPAPFSDQN